MKNSLKKGQKTAGIATLATLFLSVVKWLVGYLSGSTLLMADAIHSGVDILAIFASWFGLKVSQRKPDNKFPYGYYKVENFATLIAVGFIFYAAYEIFLRSYERLSVPSNLNLPIIAMIVPLASALISYGIAVYENRVGKEISSQSLIVNAQESKADVLSSLVVFGGIILSYFKVLYVEGIIGILLSLLILKIGYQNAKTALFSLMDAYPDEKIENDLREMINSIPGVKDVKHLKLRQSGTLLFGEAHIKVNENINVRRAHDISEVIEQDIKKKYLRIDSFLVHIEPYVQKVRKVLIPIKKDDGLDSEVVGHFGRAEFFLFAILQDGKIKSWHIKENPFINKEIRAGLEAAKYALTEKTDSIVLQQIGEISFHALKNSYIDIYAANGKTAGEVLNNFCNNRLKRLTQPTHASDK